jgi:PHD finger-like domain-containing protein 5A
MAARHHPDLVMCRKQPGTSVGKLCERCEGKCVVCDSYVRPHTVVRLCAECDFGAFAGRCTICGGPGVSDAYYCKECVQQEKDVRSRDRGAGVQPLFLLLCSRTRCTHTHTHTHLNHAQRDGCPKVINLGAAKADQHFTTKKYGSKTR